MVGSDSSLGDVNGGRVVNAADNQEAQSHKGQWADSTNFRSDVNETVKSSIRTSTLSRNRTVPRCRRNRTKHTGTAVSETISKSNENLSNSDGVGAACQLQIAKAEPSGLQTHIAATESASWYGADEKLTAFLELEAVIRCSALLGCPQ